MAILVLGGAGYIGSHMVDRLVEKGQEKVVVVDSLVTGHRAAVHPDAIFYQGDLSDQDFMRKVFKENPDVDAGESKLMMETIMKWSDQAYGIKYVPLRYFNVAGAKPDGSIGEDHGPETHLLPIILQVAQGVREKIMIFGDDYNTPDGTNVRDYVHPFDLADAHLLAVEYLRKGNESTAFNLGSSTGFSNLQILEAARKVTGKEIPAEKADRRPGDPDILIASSEKARTVLGWKPQFDNIEKIIASAWAWHSSHPKGYDDRG